ncbi:Glycoside hydrolase 2 (Mannanase, beta-galactosidase) [Ascosphaera acerosa]|nr:Glycoside hydrolase 2 (Mannanase, beta-galactosidase) [Ascosphaera acerosa]
MEQQSNRPHRPTKVKKQPENNSGKNPKAFAVAHGFRSQRQAARTFELKEKKLHVPLVDRLPEEAPPIIVAVVGPPGVGKTTLIKSLIKRYTKQTLSTPVGPLTVVTSKRRRLTFLECPSDSLAAMIDVAKIADIVLLMIDGNYGFEMETMEFLNALSASGMPGNVFGILTHLDLFKRQSSLRAAKKRLKHRFWSELYQGAKLFYLSGVQNGRYPDREIHNLSRFLSVMKNPRPLIWRNSHPYCLADRFLDITPPTAIEENPKCDRSIALYGYLRGTNFPAQGARVHVPGVGDLSVSSIEALPDPCPTPYMAKEMEKATGKTGRKRLGDKQKVLFAPMSDVGGVLVDKDAVYIDVKTSTFSRGEGGDGGGDGDDSADEDRGLGEQLVIGLQGERKVLGEADDGVQLFRGGSRVAPADLERDSGEGDTGRTHMRRARFASGQADEVDDLEGSNSGDEEEEEEFASDDEVDAAAPADFAKRFRQRQERDAQAGGKDELVFADSDSDLGSISGDDDVPELTHGSDEEEDDDDEDDADLEDGALRWKENLAANAAANFSRKIPYRISDLTRLLYDDAVSPLDVVKRWTNQEEDMAEDGDDEKEDDADDDDDDFFKKRGSEEEQLDDVMVPHFDYADLEARWTEDANIAQLKKRFASSRGSKGGDDDGDSDADSEFNGVSDDDEGDGAFEDLETGEVVEGKSDAAHDSSDDEDAAQTEDDLAAERERNAKKKEELRLRFEEEDREGFANAKEGDREEQEFGQDEWYDAQKAKLQKQLDINRAEFDSLDPLSRARAEGYKAGTYARIVLDQVPCEFSQHFNPRFPVLIGGLAPTEDRFGFVQVRIKRHRWHKKILKTNDPLIFSLGWRRFQTTPVYSIDDNRTRNRMLKYTPEHMHCFGTFYGPLVAPNTGFCCVQSFSQKNPGFRIAATGVVMNVDETTEIVKKLKLKGYPFKIYRNTAFIKGMFSSALEIAKFEGASIRTVSGIRGQIKRALAKPEGCFRATFEDKILMSDIVFLRAWFPVKPHRFYNPVTNLLDLEDQGGWKQMRLTGEVRREQGIATPLEKDSQYTKFERPTRHFNPLRVPRQLAAELPFKSQIVKMRPQKRDTYLQKRAVVLGGEEKRARALMQQLTTLRSEKAAKRAAAQEKRREVHRAKVAESLEKKAEREKRERDEYWRREGRKRKNDSEGGGSGGKKRR